jgi:hypothetical protein
MTSWKAQPDVQRIKLQLVRKSEVSPEDDDGPKRVSWQPPAAPQRDLKPVDAPSNEVSSAELQATEQEEATAKEARISPFRRVSAAPAVSYNLLANLSLCHLLLFLNV